jgi:hypothetical protein
VTAPAGLEPLLPHVQVYLDAGRQDMLTMIDVTVAALERAHEDTAADAFARFAQTCTDEDELRDLIASLITVI